MRRLIKALAIGFACGALQQVLVLLSNHGIHAADWREHLAQLIAGGVTGTILVLKQPPR